MRDPGRRLGHYASPEGLDCVLDYGTMGSFLIPNSNYFVTGGKNGTLYLLDKDAMGGWTAAAFDATNVRRELWNNRMNAARDSAGTYAKFSPPTVANGHVYLPTFSNKVVVYGLR